jgi:opacity protein-like surface antigen
MPIHSIRTLVFVAALSVCAAASSLAETDVALGIYGAFNGTTNSEGVKQSPSNAAGALLEARHISHPWLGYEATYAYNRANQSYQSFPLSACPVGITPCSTYASIKANAHEATGAWVASVKLANVRPFALGGVGLLFDVPASAASNVTSVAQTTSTVTKPVFVYGAGLDWGLLPHVGLRGQYRGNLYKAPNLTSLFTSTGKFTQTAEPMIGVYFSF